MSTCRAMLFCAIAFAAIAAAGADAQSFITTYQGVLKADGAPANGSHDFAFRLCNTSDVGGVLQTYPPAGTVAIGVADGLFTAELTFDAANFNGVDRWLEIAVDGVTLAPRQRIAFAPYAAVARGLALPFTGTFSPGMPFWAFKATNGGLGTAIHGRAEGFIGSGVVGEAAATSGTTYGGYFTSASDDGRAVFGQATNTNTANTYGGYFQSDSPIGRGVYGRGFYGGQFLSSIFGGTAVYAEQTATSGATYGGTFDAYSPTASGVLGRALAVSGVNYGVRGATNSFTDGFGVYANGRMGASGTKSFRIDHPLDPANKYLFHYCAEGPEPLNIYGGTVTTGDDGTAWVELPAYFGEINRDPRYQLTVVDEGDDFVQAKVSRRIADNRFQIRTSRPKVEVSWEVKAARNDRFVRAYGAPVEVEKSADERGTYQHPELYRGE